MVTEFLRSAVLPYYIVKAMNLNSNIIFMTPHNIDQGLMYLLPYSEIKNVIRKPFKFQELLTKAESIP